MSCQDFADAADLILPGIPEQVVKRRYEFAEAQTKPGAVELQRLAHILTYLMLYKVYKNSWDVVDVFSADFLELQAQEELANQRQAEQGPTAPAGQATGEAGGAAKTDAASGNTTATPAQEAASNTLAPGVPRLEGQMYMSGSKEGMGQEDAARILADGQAREMEALLEVEVHELIQANPDLASDDSSSLGSDEDSDGFDPSHVSELTPRHVSVAFENRLGTDQDGASSVGAGTSAADGTSAGSGVSQAGPL